MVCLFQPRLACNLSGQELSPTHASLRSATADHDYYFELLFSRRVSAFSREYSGRHGRAPAHHSRLLTSQQPQRHQPILAGNIEDQASRSGEAGRCDSTHWIVISKQVNPVSVNPRKQFILLLSENLRMNVFLELSAYWTLMDPDCWEGILVSG